MIKKLVQVYSVIRHVFNRIKFPKKSSPAYSTWKEVMGYDIIKFSEWVNSFPYKSDLLGGLIDRTPSFEHFIDRTATHTRDCDAFARMWTMWGMLNGYFAYEVIVGINGLPMKPHVVTILHRKHNGKEEYLLCDYYAYGIFNSVDSCKAKLCERWNDYNRGNLLWVENIFMKRGVFI